MHLIAPLASGINGAESGHAEIYVRGTTTRATYYTSAEGVDSAGSSTAVSTGANVSLDSNGGSSIYVNQAVDVVAKSSGGIEVRSWTEMVAAPDVEVRSDSFPGTHYTTGASAASNPTTLQAILDLWNNSAGATNWQVLFNGSDTNIQNALGSVAGLFYNVKDPAYGATGDGSTDDATAIQGAIDAAEAASGGIVFFPPGTYYCVARITLPGKVSLWGCGPNASALLGNHATNDVLETEATVSSYERQEIRGLRIGNAQSCTGYLFHVNTATLLNVVNVYFDGTNNANVLNMVEVDNAAAADVIWENCTFQGSGVGIPLHYNNSGTTWIRGCKFIQASVAENSISNLGGSGDTMVSDCLFDNTGATSGSTAGIFNTAGGVAITNCTFTAGGGATCVAMQLETIATRTIRESNNIILCATAYTLDSTIAASDDTECLLGSRVGRKTAVSDDSAAITLEADQYEVIHLIRSDSTIQTISANPAPQGARLYVTIRNSGGGNPQITFDTGNEFVDGVGTVTIATTKVRAYAFVSTVSGGNLRWVQCPGGDPHVDM